MKKFTRIFFISVLSLLVVLVIVINIAIWIVFTPERFTPIVRKQAEKYISCKSEFGEVELTFFSTFPKFGIKISRLALINPVKGSECDTLVKADELVGFVDIAAWRKNREVRLTGIQLSGGRVNVFSDSLGNTNYDIIKADTTAAEQAESVEPFPFIDIHDIEFKDMNISYSDIASGVNAIIMNLSGIISGNASPENINGKIRIASPSTSFEYGGEKYLRQASINVDMPMEITTSTQLIGFKDASISVNDLKLLLNGTVQNDTLNHNINTSITYSIDSWQIKSLLALVPPLFNKYLKGINADGILSSEGSVKGILSDFSMPVMDIHLAVNNGTLEYSDFTLPLHDIEADAAIYTDMKTDSISFVNLKKFSARTPKSGFSTEGRLNNLFSDIFCDLKTTASLTLAELDPLIPDSLKIKVSGNASGKIYSSFSLSQLEKMQLEKMVLSGNVTLTQFNAEYDSLSLKTDKSAVAFSFPCKKPQVKNTKFAGGSVIMNNIEASKTDSYKASLKNADLTFETSDVRDTTRIPDLICSFKMDHLSGITDTMSIDIENVNGKISVSPRPENPDQPAIDLTYESGPLKAIMGQNSFSVKNINLETDILNDNTQKDIFLQWLVKGFVDFNDGMLTMTELSYPVTIPLVKLKFEPENISIDESRIVIDKSDFNLRGYLNNVLSYFRGDSVLRGKFDFVSDTTDLLQLMALTNGIGNKDSSEITKEETKVAADTSYSGPYMVPMGIDMMLNARINNAIMGPDTASNITGKVQVHNGALVLDGITLQTPAAKMQMTALYRTPRKNHLYLGLDYHMLDVEIGELLTMIPDIDTLMPMLRSFGGKGEFHIAVETYLDSMYNPKKSTLRGASSVKGNDLVLMDGETFSEIAKTLKFSKKTENKVDSLSAEFTIFRNEIDIYPFLIVMDKYKAVIAGKHNFDMTFDYHISVVDCPLPIKLGINVKGDMDNLSYDLAKCRYAEYFRPSSRQVVESKQLELRKMIRETLTQKVIDR